MTKRPQVPAGELLLGLCGARSRFSGWLPAWMGWICLVLFGATLGWSQAGGESSRNRPLRVVTSFMPVYCLTAQVAGELAEVTNLLPGNVGPHDYQPTRSDIVRLNRADLLVVNGLKLEDWLERMLKGVRSDRALKTVEISKGMEASLIRGVTALELPAAGGDRKGGDHDHDHDHDHSHGHSHGEGEGGANPHVWLDPVLAAHAVTNIWLALKEADPANAAGYEANALKAVARLQALDGEYRKVLEPLKAAPFITYHDAFAYLSRRYGLTIVGVVEQTPEVSPGPKYLDALRKTIQERKVRAIFAEPQFPKRLAEQLAKDTGVKLGTLDTLETAADGKLSVDDYEQGMRRNLEVLARHLK